MVSTPGCRPQPALATHCPTPFLSDWACPVRGRLPDHRGRAVRRLRRLHQREQGTRPEHDARNYAKTSWLSPPPAGAPEAALSARSRVRLPQALASLGQSAAWAALVCHITFFSTQARPGGSAVRHHCSHGRGYKILARQRRCCCSRSHKTGTGGTRPGGCVGCVCRAGPPVTVVSSV